MNRAPMKSGKSWPKKNKEFASNEHTCGKDAHSMAGVQPTEANTKMATEVTRSADGNKYSI